MTAWRSISRLAPVLSIVAVLSGCADTHSVQKVINSGHTLSPSASAYVTTPADGRYGKTVYDGSGRMTSDIVATAFMRRLSRVDQADGPQSNEEALASARKMGATYLVAPDILQWEDRATEWSGKPDRAEIRLRVVDTATERVIASGLISGQSGLATLGGDKPQDLLRQPTENYVGSLF